MYVTLAFATILSLHPSRVRLFLSLHVRWLEIVPHSYSAVFSIIMPFQAIK